MLHVGRWQFLIIWQFRVRAGMEADFEATYGPAGDWARFFSEDKAYVATELVRDAAQARHYLTLDFWASRAAYENFRATHAAEYRALDEKCEQLTEDEAEIGCFEHVG